MKKHLLKTTVIAALLLSPQIMSAQGLAVNTAGSAADASAMLDVQSTSQGVLVPRMTTANRNAIASPATGLLIYQTDGTTGFYFNSGTPGAPVWTSVGGGAPSGTAGGNLAG